MALEWKRGTFTYDVVGLGHTIVNAQNAVQSFLTQVGWIRVSWDTSTDRYYVRSDWATNPYWRYTGDGPNQRCGLRVTTDEGNNRLVIKTFLEDAGQTASQIDTPATYGLLQLDATAPNNMLMIGGEGGFYLESGRDGTPTNLAMFMVIAWEGIPIFNGTDDARLRYTTQGTVLDLFGQIRFSRAYGTTFLGEQNTPGKYFTGGFLPQVARGVSGLNGQVPVNNQTIGVGNRDYMCALSGSADGGGDTQYGDCRFTFGLFNTPRDGQYRIAPLMVDQTREHYYLHAGYGAPVTLFDTRALRHVPKFAAVDWTLIPFVNLTDQATGIIYRVGQVPDAGRTCNIGVVWPDASNIVTITG